MYIFVSICSLWFCIWSALNVCLLYQEINEWLSLESKHFQTLGHKTGGNVEDLIGYEPDPLSYSLKNPIWKSPPEEDKKRWKQRRRRSGHTGQFKKLEVMFIFQLIPTRVKHCQVLTLNLFACPPCLTLHASPE